MSGLCEMRNRTRSTETHQNEQTQLEISSKHSQTFLYASALNKFDTFFSENRGHLPTFRYKCWSRCLRCALRRAPGAHHTRLATHIHINQCALANSARQAAKAEMAIGKRRNFKRRTTLVEMYATPMHAQRLLLEMRPALEELARSKPASIRVDKTQPAHAACQAR
jgi:hypothetical protein